MVSSSLNALGLVGGQVVSGDVVAAGVPVQVAQALMQEMAQAPMQEIVVEIIQLTARLLEPQQIRHSKIIVPIKPPIMHKARGRTRIKMQTKKLVKMQSPNAPANALHANADFSAHSLGGAAGTCPLFIASALMKAY
jgi:hypothetical protein